MAPKTLRERISDHDDTLAPARAFAARGGVLKRLVGAAVAAALWAGCGPAVSHAPYVPLDLLVVSSAPDSFSVAGVRFAVSDTRTYAWSCSRPQADLSIGSILSQGSVRLEVFDGAGALVHDNTYSATLLGDVTAVTRSGGTPGAWTLRFTFHSAQFSGAIELTAHPQNQPNRIDVGGTDALDASWIFQPGWGAGPVHVDAGGVSAGSFRIRLWDGAQKLVLDQTVSGVGDFTKDVTGFAGVWTVQLDFFNAAELGDITLTQS